MATQRRKLSELLELMLDRQPRFEGGLCLWAMHAIVHLQPYHPGWEECAKDVLLVKNYIKKNKPLNFRTLLGYNYYWEEGDIEPRIKWLEKHISKLKKLGL
jgi:hypothetical protein